MSVERAREYLKKYNKDKDIIHLEDSAATVELAAKILNVEPKRIAKSIALRGVDESILIVTAGDAKIDNAKFKNEFGYKARMLTYEETLEKIGHEVGGVCPFGIKDNVRVYSDISIKRFDTVFPACGGTNDVIELAVDDIYNISKSIKWVDVCKEWE